MNWDKAKIDAALEAIPDKEIDRVVRRWKNADRAGVRLAIRCAVEDVLEAPPEIMPAEESAMVNQVMRNLVRMTRR